MRHALRTFVLTLGWAPALALAQTNQPPIVDAGPDQTIFLGEAAFLEGSATDPDGDAIVSWLWTIESAPEGSAAIVFNPQSPLTFFDTNTAGDHLLSLVASDGTDFSLPDFLTIHVVVNLPPVAIVTADVTSGPAPLTVNFDASQSFDPEGGTLFYDWSFSDGSPSSSEVSPTRVFTSPGTFIGGLTVLDDFGQIDSAIIQITVFAQNIAVAPSAVEFGTVALGSSTTAMVTLSNVGSTNLIVSDLALASSGSGDFSITLGPTLPVTIAPGSDPVDVELTFAPSTIGLLVDTLEITSDDPFAGLVEVALSGTGELSEPPPEQQIADILAFFDQCTADDTCVGIDFGNPRAAEARERSIRNQIEAAGDLLADGLIEDACDLLRNILNRMNESPQPPDFLTGSAIPELVALIKTLRATLGCDGCPCSFDAKTLVPLFENATPLCSFQLDGSGDINFIEITSRGVGAFVQTDAATGEPLPDDGLGLVCIE